MILLAVFAWALAAFVWGVAGYMHVRAGNDIEAATSLIVSALSAGFFAGIILC